jgi:hypothetical protein
MISNVHRVAMVSKQEYRATPPRRLRAAFIGNAAFATEGVETSDHVTIITSVYSDNQLKQQQSPDTKERGTLLYYYCTAQTILEQTTRTREHRIITASKSSYHQYK